jgi:hypothetical protein
LCYYLYLASPLTLSEVRSMIAPGLSAELLPPAEGRALLRHHPDAQTAARLLHGACSCDLVRYRQPVSREDEVHLRSRYREQGLSREATIRALETHRRALDRRQRPEGHWPASVAAFVVEHARNAGPTLFYLHFSHDGQLKIDPAAESVVTLPVTAVKENPGGWLPEERLVMVVRR